MQKSFEKRQFDRLKTEHLLVQYRYLDGENIFEVEIINIGAGGACFLRNSVITKGDVIEILFPFKSKKVILKTKIVRIEGREVAGKFIEKQDKIDELINLFNEEYKIIKKEREKEEQEKNSLYAEKNKHSEDKKMFDI